MCVSGELSTREYEGKTYLTLRAAEVTLMGGKPDSGDRQEQHQEPREPLSQRNALDDEIPFAPEARA